MWGVLHTQQRVQRPFQHGGQGTHYTGTVHSGWLTHFHEADRERREGLQEGNSCLYTWKKSRFHLTDGHGRADGKFILNICSRNVCRNKCHFVDREEGSGVVR